MGALPLRLVRLSFYLLLTLPLMPVQALLVASGSAWARRLPRLYHRWSSRILGFRVAVQGERSARRPTLFVANHVSYVDIEILGGVIEGSFIAKAEVARWPLFGWLAKLQRTVFVDRRIRSTAAQRDAIRERLDAGADLILFPEGTSGDGNRILPFKSALFSVADYARQGTLTVQPLSIAYLRLDGIPMGRAYRPFFAWYGDMALGPHLWTMLGLGTVDVTVTFHPPVTLAEFGSRKALAEHCHRIIAAGMASALAGREPEPAGEPLPAAKSAREAAE
ncbi:MAG TPA: lysophospholipid acyltransferase family protein [Stellaceae bacterium]